MNQPDHRVRVCLQNLAALCCEVADRPWLLPTFLRIVALVPSTIVELTEARRRIAA
jgi:hypothetical protein